MELKINENFFQELIFKNGKTIFESKGYGIIWISIGNPFFNEHNLKILFDYTKSNFSKIFLVVPKESAIHTFVAMGYSKERAIQKSRLQFNRINNMVTRILRNKNYSQNIIINDWNTISENLNYNIQLNIVNKLYEDNFQFRHDIDSSTLKVLKNNLHTKELNTESVKIGKNYILEELAFILSSPKIFNTTLIGYIYHKKWDILCNLVNGKYDKVDRPDIGIIITEQIYV